MITVTSAGFSFNPGFYALVQVSQFVVPGTSQFDALGFSQVVKLSVVK